MATNDHDELRDKARRLSSEGKTYGEIADEFRRNSHQWDGQARHWAKSDIARLMRDEDPFALSESAAHSGAGPMSLAGPSEEEYRRVTMFWIRVIGWIVLVWAVSSVAVGIWIAVEAQRDAKEADRVASGFESYADCIADDATTLEQCEDLFK